MRHGSLTTNPARDLLDLDARRREAVADRSNIVAGGKFDRPALEAGRVLGRGPDADTPPDVDDEMVVIAPGGDERGSAHDGLLLEAEGIAIERERLGDVADMQMDVADAQPLGDVRRRMFVRRGGKERRKIEGPRAAAR
jgi:hypothetical protein